MKVRATRDQIVEAADRLIYEKGFEYMAFADLANAVGISRGNVSFHFKTRDEILSAVIELRFGRTRRMLEQWETEGIDARERIRSYIRIPLTNRTQVLRYGCPVGTLCTELAKLGHDDLVQASRIFGLFREWLGRQFTDLGLAGHSDALAMQVLAWSQGVATLASAFHDEPFVRAEVRRMEDWLDSLVPGSGRPRRPRKLRGRQSAPARHP
ncbi:MAG: TetR/AcrR family transcriptional regulator [Verrucomicrobiales bacterium]|nr:TetR/AcrR family transcriptional regulator [Verrucomicrobiales bacterium]